MPSKRLDTYMVEAHLAPGREKAKELIAGGQVTINGKLAQKPSTPVKETDVVVCQSDAFAYVSRGSLKLEKALCLSGMSVEGCVAMDIGASTGGFTQCLLNHGAAKVYAVDVGHDQLHELLRCDPRVENWERTDIRSEQLKEAIPAGSLDLITADVSFISLRQILPFALPFLKESGFLILLIKPQFEAGKADVGKNGIVRDRAVHLRVLRELTGFFNECGCSVSMLTGSPITGGAGRSRGNVEYLVCLSHENTGRPVPDIRRVVEEAFLLF